MSVKRDEEVIIANGSKPVVTLKKVAVSGERVAGKNRGKVVIADDFDEALPDFSEYQ
jgi:antitoxin (DNA-binding transcriptional repressor) of toxin-antitoxin stability system